jgi:protein-L-isoaspartate(D-aspartate) O-methyltransferase
MILNGILGRRPPVDLAAERTRMVERDLAARGIRDPRLLAAMGRVPRERFVPPEFHALAYADRALPIGADQTISQPYMVALMIEMLGLRGGETVLEVGVGSGYATAVLAELANWVIGIERIPELAAGAGARLGDLGIVNVEIHVGDGSRGFSPGAPYEGILVSAAAPRVPEPLLLQLADGGFLVIPIGEESGIQVLTRFRRTGPTVLADQRCSCRFVPLVSDEATARDIPGQAGAR